MILTSNCLSCLNNLSAQKLKFWRKASPSLVFHDRQVNFLIPKINKENNQRNIFWRTCLTSLQLCKIFRLSTYQVHRWDVPLYLIVHISRLGKFFLWGLIKNGVYQSQLSYMLSRTDGVATATLHQKSGREQTAARLWLSLGCRPHHLLQQSLLIVQN